MRVLSFIIVSVALAAGPAAADDSPLPKGFDAIETIVVVYQENRGFSHLLPEFPGAFSVDTAPESALVQRDRDGSVLPHLPPVWQGDKIPSGAPAE